MDTKTYIESGILESYVLSSTSDRERKEVECMSKIYPELQTELDLLEISMEQYARAYSISPLDALRAKVLTAMKQVKPENESTKEVESTAKIIPITPYKLGFQLAAAASVILLMGFFFYYQQIKSQWEEFNNNLAQVEENARELEKTVAASNSANTALLADLQILKDTANRSIIMTGVGAHKDALATVYWNGQQPYLDVQQLPVPTEAKQYQLWAIVDGVPVDAGIFDVVEDSMSLQKMKPVENAQAFAVTLEVKGGSPTPNLEAMYVVGNVGA